MFPCFVSHYIRILLLSLCVIFCVACKVFRERFGPYNTQRLRERLPRARELSTPFPLWSIVITLSPFVVIARLSLLPQQVFIVYLLLSKYTLTNTPSLQAPPPRAYYDKVGSFFVSLTRSVFHFIFSSVFNSFFQTFLAPCVFISFLLTPSPNAPTPLAGRTPPLLARRVFNSAWSDRRERKAS